MHRFSLTTSANLTGVGDVVALLVGHRTCDSQVAVGIPASYLHLCASVTK